MSATAFGSTRTRGWPRRGVLTMLLAISFALNVFFIAGAVWSRLHPPPGYGNRAERIQQIASQLDLNPQERGEVDRYIATIRARMEQMQRELEPLYSEAWADLAKPDADPAAVMRLFDQANDTKRTFQHDLATQTLTLLGHLSPAQRAKFVALVHERRQNWRQSGSGSHAP